MTTQALPGSVRPLDAGIVSTIVLLCMCWGLNQVAIKFCLPDIPVIMQVALRSGGGLLIVLCWIWWRGIALFERDGTLVPGVISGLLFALEFVLIFSGMAHTTASRASLFIYTAPFFVALGARRFLPHETLTSTQWLGLALCFAGVAAAIGVPQADVGSQVLWGDMLVIAGAAGWAATTLVMKASRLVTIAPEKTLLYQLSVSVPIFVATSAAFGERITTMPRSTALAWMLFQILVVGLTFPIWFTLIQRYQATRVSAFTVLTPLFGVAAGCLLLNEPFTIAFGIAVVLVVAGLTLVNRPR
ncbi:MAG TPA: DMT family transporter [Xanthobacteraceae bacterium]|nr:DMT family transporter [Xanthobacteraceae bacterium]